MIEDKKLASGNGHAEHAKSDVADDAVQKRHGDTMGPAPPRSPPRKPLFRS
jgi:hypothetical protein